MTTKGHESNGHASTNNSTDNAPTGNSSNFSLLGSNTTSVTCVTSTPSSVTSNKKTGNEEEVKTSSVSNSKSSRDSSRQHPKSLLNVAENKPKGEHENVREPENYYGPDGMGGVILKYQQDMEKKHLRLLELGLLDDLSSEDEMPVKEQSAVRKVLKRVLPKKSRRNDEEDKADTSMEAECAVEDESHFFALRKAVFAKEWNGVEGLLSKSFGKDFLTHREIHNLPEVYQFVPTQRLFKETVSANTSPPVSQRIGFVQSFLSTGYKLANEVVSHTSNFLRGALFSQNRTQGDELDTDPDEYFGVDVDAYIQDDDYFDDLYVITTWEDIAESTKSIVSHFCDVLHKTSDTSAFRETMEERIRQIESFIQKMKINHFLLKNVGFPRAPIRRSFESHITLNSQRTGLKSVKISPVDGEPDKCYKWTGRGAVRNNVKHMVCCGCRAIWDKMPVGERPSLPTMKFDLERNEWIDIFPNNPHFCTPLLKNQVRGRQIRYEQLANVKTSRSKPAAVGVNITEAVSTRYANLPEDDELSVLNAAQGQKKETLARAVHRVNASLYPHITTVEELNQIQGSSLLLTMTAW